MLNVWLSLLTFMISLTSFSFAYRLSNINKIFYLLPRSIMENAIRLDRNEMNAYFDQDYLENGVKNYFSQNLNNLLDNYEISFDYFNYKGSDDPFFIFVDGVNISFRANVILDFNYVNSLTFTIKEHE